MYVQGSWLPDKSHAKSSPAACMLSAWSDAMLDVVCMQCMYSEKSPLWEVAASCARHVEQCEFALQDLPRHCLVENQTEGLMISVGLAIMLLEMSAMYCTLTCVLNLASKRLD